jgi:ammonium transporter, Amt family
MAQHLTLEAEKLRRYIIASLGLALLLVLLSALPALAQGGAGANNPLPSAPLIPGVLLLLPLGILLAGSSALPESETAVAVATALVGWGLATLAYLAVGFAFQFGGVAVYPHLPLDSDLAGLSLGWSPYDLTVPFEVSRLWRVIGLSGYLLTEPASTSGALSLFASHLALVGIVVIPAALTLYNRARRLALVLASLLLGGFVYPLLGNWIWGGGWLQNLGASLGYGHGTVDFGGAFVFAAGGLAALSAALVFRRPRAEDTRPAPASAGDQIVPMPAAHLPLLGLLGAGLAIIGSLTLAEAPHLAIVWPIDTSRVVVNTILAALSGGLAAASYSWFATARFDPFMTPRGVLSGLAVISAAAPFIPVWVAVSLGLVAGLILPLLLFTLDRFLPGCDRPGLAVTLGVSGVLGLFVVALFADGTSGLGWNATLAEARLGVANQGVSGLMVAEGFAFDWPSQFTAQSIGAASAVTWVLGISVFLFRSLASMGRVWAWTGQTRPGLTPSDLSRDPVPPTTEQSFLAEEDVGSPAR